MSQKSQPPQFEPPQMTRQVPISVPWVSDYIYVDAAAFSLSEFDLRISFGEALPDRTVKPNVGLVMSVEHAAFMLMRMFNLLSVFEQNTGPIRHREWRDFYTAVAGQVSSHVHASPVATQDADIAEEPSLG